jgi:hypothetical protein
MIIEQGSQSDFLRALLRSPQFGLPDYSADPIVQRRVGRAIAEVSDGTAPKPQPVCSRQTSRNLIGLVQVPLERELPSRA